jgi:hypothetical protein
VSLTDEQITEWMARCARWPLLVGISPTHVTL